MTPELKSRWLAALRSGEYEQGRNTMNRQGRMCCLGVLCDVAGLKWRPEESDVLQCDAGSGYIERPEFLEGFGLSQNIHDLAYSLNDGTTPARLKNKFPSIDLDQDPQTFAEIADILEILL